MNARVSGGHRAIPQASPGHRLRAPDAGKTKPHEAWVLRSFIRGAQSSAETSTGDPHGSGFPWPHHKGSRINTNTSVPTKEPHDLTVPRHLPRVFPVSPRGPLHALRDQSTHALLPGLLVTLPHYSWPRYCFWCLPRHVAFLPYVGAPRFFTAARRAG